MQQPVLVPLDGSALAEQALPYAEALAGSACELILLEVGEDEDSEFRLPERHDDSCAQLEVAVGDPVEQILDVAQELGAGLIVMTSRGRGASGHAAMGRVADAVTRRSSVPVLVVRPQANDGGSAPPAIQRLVVPLDGSPLDDTALPVAQSLAKTMQLPMHLIAVDDASSLVSEEVAPDSDVEHAVDTKRVLELDATAEGMLTRLSQRLATDGQQVSTEVLHGAPHQAIAGATQPGDIIVMPRHGRSGKKRSLLERAADTLVREGAVPVLLVPSGLDRASQSQSTASAALGSGIPEGESDPITPVPDER